MNSARISQQQFASSFTSADGSVPEATRRPAPQRWTHIMHTYAVSLNRCALSEARNFSKLPGRSSITFRGCAAYGKAARTSLLATMVVCSRRTGCGQKCIGYMLRSVSSSVYLIPTRSLLTSRSSCLRDRKHDNRTQKTAPEGLDSPDLRVGREGAVTAAKTAAKTMASYGHLTTGLGYRPSRQSLLDGPGRLA